MEAKKILGLIKEDIAHLEEITRDFSVEKLPSSDDVDLSIIRAKALLTELELLQKLTSLEKPEPHITYNTELQSITPYSPKVPTNGEIEIAQTTVVQDEINAFKPEVAELVETKIELEIDKVGKAPMPEMGLVLPITEAPVVIELIVPDERQLANEHNKGETHHTGTDLQKSINERLMESNQVKNDFQPTENASLGYPVTPIKLIWDAIGINDRFLFVRELFENNSSKFEATVKAIDELSSIQEAVNYLKLNFKWNNSEASQRFLILVKQRFTK